MVGVNLALLAGVMVVLMLDLQEKDQRKKCYLKIFHVCGFQIFIFDGYLQAVVQCRQ